MNVPDYSKQYIDLDNSCGKHCPIFAKNIFCVIAGSTGSGKTNLMIHLLKEKGLLNYADLYVYSSTLHQPAYEYLKHYYKKVEDDVKILTKQSVKIAHFLDADGEIVNPS